ncbi:MAG: ABC transporter permease [Gammaproteobacteria bacterium]
MKRFINLVPGRGMRWVLTALPFVLIVVVYLAGSQMRLAANPSDKLLPSLAQFAEAVDRLAFKPSGRTGEYELWMDTLASLQRLVLGVGVSALLGLSFGIASGILPYLHAGFSPFITVVSMIPPMAVLPILFIVLGLGETAKVRLIVIGIAPFLIRDLESRVLELPAEQIIKAQTLGASTWQLIVRVVLPQVLPRLFGALRLSLGPAWLFLIAAEAIAAEQGLGYRIFLVRRYLAMDVILPYVAWITLLALLMDMGLKRATRAWFPWFGGDAQGRGA